MKLFINEDQIKELNQIQIDSLRNWWKPQVGDKHTCGWITEIDNDELCHGFCGDGFTFKKKDVLPLLSIGQMIEFINEKNIFCDIEKDDDLFEVHVWTKSGFSAWCMPREELADALWEAVKDNL